MRFEDLATILNEHTYVHLVSTEGDLLDVYNGRDAIDPKYGKYEVTDLRLSNTLIPNKYITVEVMEA